MQRTITLALAAGLAGCALFISSAAPTAAQSAGTSASGLSSQPHPIRARTRIVVTPSPRVYRRCVDWYAVEHRATGDTVVPNMRCWWAYR